ncbi:MAG: YCF48-related protein [Anaerolineae bacterium]|nr:YCF48-related protein [Anaerolineae bacterium]MDW8100059.1 YCF48-related protein [Anaerolineae bacterium]
MHSRIVVYTGLLLSLWLLVAPEGAGTEHPARHSELALSPLNEPHGAVIALAQHPSHPEQLWAIAATQTPLRSVTALYRSTNGGTTWEPAGNDLSWLNFTTLAVTATGDLLLGTDDGLYRRSVADQVWRRVALEMAKSSPEQAFWPPQGMIIRQIILSEADPARLYVIAAENQRRAVHWLFRSGDGGHSFERFLIQEIEADSRSGLGRVLIDPADADRLYAATWGSILISRDGGVTWEPGGLDPSLAEGVIAIALAPDQPEKLFAVRAIRDDRGTHLAFNQSQDGGRTWSESTIEGVTNARPVDLAALPSGRLILSTDQGVLIRPPNSGPWTVTGGDLGEMGAFQLLVDRAGPETVWAATPLGVYRQRKGELGWTAHNQGLPPNGRVQALHSSPYFPNVWLAAMAWSPVSMQHGDEGIAPPSVLRATDGGRNWQVVEGLSKPRVYHFAEAPQQPGRIYAATQQGVCRSEDGGHSWTQCALTAQIVQSVQAGSGTRVYAGTYGGGLYFSQDGGETWAPIGFAGSNITNVLLRSDGLYVVVQGSNAGLYRTRDDGASWQILNWPAEPGVEMMRLAGNDQVLLAAMPGRGLWLSQDAGLTWVQASGLPQDAAFDTIWTDPRMPHRIFAARSDAGLWMSEDNGNTWKLVGETLGDNKVLDIAADYGTANGVVVATQMAGVWAGRRSTRQTPPSAVDARIEILWPQGWAPVAQATRANLSLRLFQPDSLEPVPCGWMPPVEIWEARDNEPARRLRQARPRRIGDALSSLWDANDLDVSHAQRPEARLYYIVRVPNVITRTSVWAHAADSRTYYPRPAQPTAVSNVMPTGGELDARILIVWPHDAAGRPQPVEEAELVNVRAALYLPGTLTSIPPEPRLTVRLMGALNNEVGRVLGIGRMRLMSAPLSYPVWEFDNVDVSAIRHTRSYWTFWLEVDGYLTRSNLWVHGTDARTNYPKPDQPIVGCRP